MAYKGFISNGEDYVGELSSLRKRLLKTVRKKDIVRQYEDEAELIAHSDQLDREKEDYHLKSAHRMCYVLFWASQKHEDIVRHSKRGCWNPCLSCSLCQCRRAMGTERFHCLCPEGKKMLSPYRIIFLNSAIREDWRTKVYEVGQGWVPKTEQGTRAPNWQELIW